MSTEYIKTSWQDGDIITADKMNNIENGIKDVEEVATGLKEDISEASDDVLDIQIGKNKLNLDELINGYYHSPTNIVTDDRYWCNPNGYVVKPGEYVYVSYYSNNIRRTDYSIRSYVLLNTDGTVAQAIIEDTSALNANAYKYHNETENTYLIVPNFWFTQGTDFALYITDKSPNEFGYLNYEPYVKDSTRLLEIESNIEKAKKQLSEPYDLTDRAEHFSHFSEQRYYLQSSTNKIINTQNNGKGYKCFSVDITELTGDLYILTGIASAYRVIYVSAVPEVEALAIGSFNYLDAVSLGIGSLMTNGDSQLVMLDLAKVIEVYPTAEALYITVPHDDQYDCFLTCVERKISPLLYADDSIPNTALVHGDNYVISKDSVVVEEDEVTLTATSAGTYISKPVRYNLKDLNLAVGDHVYLTIGEQTGCADNNIFSLEAYRGTTRLLQTYATKNTMATDMEIPEGTDTLAFVYRLSMSTSVEAGTVATWSDIKLYYYVKEEGLKIIPPEYYIPGAITEVKLNELETRTERSLLYDTSVYGDVDTAIEDAFSTIGRKKFLMLAWISDLHRRPFTGTADAPVANPDTVFYNTVEVMKYLNKRLPLHAVLDTGDIILGYQPFFGFSADVNFKYEAEYFRSFNEACELYLYTPGNHDGYNANSVTLQDTDYQIGASALNRKIESKQPGKCYYYIDYPDISTRLLVLAIPGGGSNLGMDSEQLQWIASTGLGNVPDGYGVIMAYHIPTVCISYLEGGVGGFGNRVSFEGLVNAFHNHTTYSDSIVTADFSSKINTKIVAALCGHMHVVAHQKKGNH